MQIPLQISWRNLDKSPSLEAAVRKHARKLERYFQPINSCRVMIEKPHDQHHQGNLFHLRLDIRVPDKEIVVDRSGDHNHQHEDIYIALHDAFDAAARQLQDYNAIRQGQTKRHDILQNATVTKHFKSEGFGFLSTADGREVYFDRYALQDDSFDSLEVGSAVSFVEEQGDKGPQAKKVVLGKHKIV